MRKFDAKFKIGTKVKIFGLDEIVEVSEIHETRNWIKIKGYLGSFQRNHVISFSNK